MDGKAMKLILHELFNHVLSQTLYMYGGKIFNNLILDEEHDGATKDLWRQLIETNGNCVELALNEVVEHYDSWDYISSSQSGRDAFNMMASALKNAHKVWGNGLMDHEGELILACRELVRSALQKKPLLYFINKPLEKNRRIKENIGKIIDIMVSTGHQIAQC